MSATSEAADERFLLCYVDTTDYPPPQMVDAEQLRERIVSGLRALHLGQIDDIAELPQMYRIIPGAAAHLERLELQCANPHEPFNNEHDLALREWTVSGTESLWSTTVVVQVDLRA